VDPYSVLGIGPSATLNEIRVAYRDRARQHHPDTGGDEQAMTLLNVAYGLLRDSASRAAYDRKPKATRFEPEQPPWTGKAGPPPGRPAGPVLDFGLFAGWSLGEIARHDPGYLVWLAERMEGRPHLAAIERYVAPYRDTRFGRGETAAGSAGTRGRGRG
jgi:curved DNA-binding protein CbpA